MVEARRWASEVVSRRPHILAQIHPNMVESILKNICETSHRCLPNYRGWLNGGNLDLARLVYGRVTTPEFLMRRALELGMMLGPSVRNDQWTATVAVNLALYEVIPLLVE
jgi:hypothetical protein